MQLRYVTLIVRDLRDSVRFYRDLLGIRLIEESRTAAEFDTGGATLALHLAHVDGHGKTHHPPMIAGSCRLSFYVDDLDHVHQRLVKAGVPCLNPPETKYDMRVALYEDPDGINFTVAERSGATSDA
ncbi:MAG: VOC family protein [Gemmatimonadota bacterium]